MTYAHVWHDPFINVAWLIHKNKHLSRSLGRLTIYAYSYVYIHILTSNLMIQLMSSFYKTIVRGSWCDATDRWLVRENSFARGGEYCVSPRLCVLWGDTYDQFDLIWLRYFTHYSCAWQSKRSRLSGYLQSQVQHELVMWLMSRMIHSIQCEWVMSHMTHESESSCP